MPAFSIGDLSRHLILRHEVTRAKMELTTLVEEVASERKSDVARALRGEVSELSSLEASTANLSSWARTASLQATRLAAQQRALGSMDQMANELWAKLTLSEPATPQSQKKIIADDSVVTLDRMLAQLNSLSGGESLFSGGQTDQSAVSDGAALLSNLRSAVSGLASASDIHDAVVSWFSQPGGYDSVTYAGGVPRPGLRIGEYESTRASVTALAPEIREVLAGVALAALAADYLTPQDQEVGASLINMGADRLLDGSSERISLMARVGVDEHHIAKVLSRNNAELAALTLRRREVLGINGYEAASALQGVQKRLELLYTMTARLSELSLVGALR
ncbi:hypothetical protein [Falsigemmobacter faecalis]|uniref:Uncharacterized protein n=1 Tax=Falsigemmobacter faecalis TaxID=2488730 RepID=A0A3P3DYY5_9RHOB|nr:hypothetical protein [Falsigemmobacter faecalis]RRH78048.1 hypothetical protein EG244_03245 [Falsigemmobacter faecalis]